MVVDLWVIFTSKSPMGPGGLSVDRKIDRKVYQVYLQLQTLRGGISLKFSDSQEQ